jgi:hypothetical protein
MRIYDGSGNQVGKVGGNRSLISEDENLKRFFRENVAGIGGLSMKEWLGKTGKALQK